MSGRTGARDMTKWETSISKIISGEDEEEVIIRGRKLSDLVGKVTFSEMMFLLIQGKLPSPGQGRVLDALLVASMEHGISPPAMLSRCHDTARGHTRTAGCRVRLGPGNFGIVVRPNTACGSVEAQAQRRRQRGKQLTY